MLKNKNISLRRRGVFFMAAMGAFFIFMSVSPARAQSKFDIKKLLSPNHGADYIVVAPAAYVGALEPLLDHRADGGMRVAVATTENIHKSFFRAATGSDAIRAFVRYAWHKWEKPSPKYLLIVGDTIATETYKISGNTIPTFLLRTDSDPLTASDNPYADMDGDELPDIAVGRLPADSPAELARMVEKIIAYEKAAPAGEWRRRVSVFASEGHFGAAIDSMLEEMFKKLVGNNVSPLYDLNMTYANPNMAYFYVPSEFNEKVIDRFNEGSLLMIYIGHGLARGFDTVRVGKNRYPIMGLEDIPRIDNGGRSQFLFIIACDTGKFHLPYDSIGEQLFKSPTGPIGVFASTEVSHPYSNALLAKDIAYYMLTEKPDTIGEALLNIKRGLIERLDPDRKLIDGKAKLMMKPRELEALNRDHLFMYNFLGDPATRINYPSSEAKIAAPAEASSGDVIPLKITVPGGAEKVTITLECPVTEVLYETKSTEGLKGKELDDAIRKNYSSANNKVAASINVVPVKGETHIETGIKIPAWAPEGTYFVKLYATGNSGDSMGYTRIRIGKTTEN